MKPIVMQVLGYVFLVLGVLGMFLPILQGFLFLFIGLIILGRYATWARNLLEWLRERYPRFGATVDRAEQQVHSWQDRVGSWFRR